MHASTICSTQSSRTPQASVSASRRSARGLVGPARCLEAKWRYIAALASALVVAGSVQVIRAPFVSSIRVRNPR